MGSSGGLGLVPQQYPETGQEGPSEQRPVFYLSGHAFALPGDDDVFSDLKRLLCKLERLSAGAGKCIAPSVYEYICGIFLYYSGPEQ